MNVTLNSDHKKQFDVWMWGENFTNLESDKERYLKNRS